MCNKLYLILTLPVSIINLIFLIPINLIHLSHVFYVNRAKSKLWLQIITLYIIIDDFEINTWIFSTIKIIKLINPCIINTYISPRDLIRKSTFSLTIKFHASLRSLRQVVSNKSVCLVVCYERRLSPDCFNNNQKKQKT